jgi:hypothetical protein
VLYLWYTRILVATMTGVWCGAGQVLLVLCHVCLGEASLVKMIRSNFLCTWIIPNICFCVHCQLSINLFRNWWYRNRRNFLCTWFFLLFVFVSTAAYPPSLTSSFIQSLVHSRSAFFHSWNDAYTIVSSLYFLLKMMFFRIWNKVPASTEVHNLHIITNLNVICWYQGNKPNQTK